MNFGLFATHIALWIVVAFQGLMIVALLLKLEKLQQLVERGASAPIGSLAPEFTGRSQFDQETSLSMFDGRGGILLFLAPGCSLCERLLGSIDTSQDMGLPKMLVVCRGDKDRCAGVVKRLGRDVAMIVDHTGTIASTYGATVFPRAVIVDGHKKIRGYSYPRTADDLRRAFQDDLSESDTTNTKELHVGSLNPV
jgi:hypothetical protein